MNGQAEALICREKRCRFVNAVNLTRQLSSLRKEVRRLVDAESLA